MSPVRIQRKRTKGWRMPPNTVCVGRPTIYGNPFGANQFSGLSPAGAVDMYRRWWGGRGWIEGTLLYPGQMDLLMGAMYQTEPHPLRGKNLACWCPLDRPCHADVLLRIANEPARLGVLL